MGARDCCARSQHETMMTLEEETTLGITPRECAIRAEVSDPCPLVPPIQCGRGQCESCKDIAEYKQSLYYDDYVIRHTPDLQRSGCFQYYAWVPVMQCAM
eukprot:7071009-Pyramimonas_sp.AAC.1